MKNVFRSTQNSSWHPPGARGIYGGTIIAQSLIAASSTLDSKKFHVHSMHCDFTRGGSSDDTVFYHVGTTGDDHSFANRTVQARQNGALIATATVSFTLPPREKQGYLRHCLPIAASALTGGRKHEIPGSVEDPVEIDSGPEEALESCLSSTLNSKSFQFCVKNLSRAFRHCTLLIPLKKISLTSIQGGCQVLPSHIHIRKRNTAGCAPLDPSLLRQVMLCITLPYLIFLIDTFSELSLVLMGFRTLAV